MTRPLDDDALEWMLSGRAPSGEPEWALLADAVADIRALVDAPIPRGVVERHVGAAAAEALERSATPSPHVPARGGRVGRSLPALATRLVTVVAAVVALSAGAAAAGVLPAPVQRAFSEVASLFRFDIAFPEGPADTTAPVAGDELPVGPPVTTTTVPEVAPPATTTTTIAIPPPDVVLSMAPDTDAVAETGGNVTFHVEVVNTGSSPVTLLALTDDAFGDLLDPSNEAVSGNSCARGDVDLDPGEAFACSFLAFLAGDSDGPGHRSTTTTVVADDHGVEAFAALTARVSFLPVTVAVGVAVTPSVTALDEPGGVVTMLVRVSNRSTVPAALTSLEDSVFGNLLDPDGPFVFNNTCPAVAGVTRDAGATISCAFDAFIVADAVAGGIDHTAVASVTGTGPTTVSASTAYRVEFVDVLPEISVTASADAIAVGEPGESVDFTIVLRNHSVEPVLVTTLEDSVYGDLLQLGNPSVLGNTCARLPVVIEAGAALRCGFSAEVSGSAGGAAQRATVSATAVDNEGNETGAADATAIGFAPEGTLITGRVFFDFEELDDMALGLVGVRVRITVAGLGMVIVTTNEHGQWAAVVPPGEVTVVVAGGSVPAALSLKTGNARQVLDAVAGATISADPVGYGPGG